MRYARSVLTMALWLGGADCALAEVGLRTLTYPDPVHGGASPAAVWYPTAAPEQPVRRGPYTFSVAENGPATTGRHPLVVVSHGSGGSAFNHADTAMMLARRGYVVLAVHHRGNAIDSNSDAGTEKMLRGRPVQLSAALDSLLAHPDLGGHVDAGRIGALGFSSGAYTVLVAAGGVAELTRIADYCLSPPVGERFCHLGNEVARGTVAAADPRIRAAVLLAPVGIPFTRTGLAQVTIPVRLYRAEHDAELAPSQAEAVRDALPAPPEYVKVNGAGHFSFLAPFPPVLTAEIGAPAQDPPGFDRAAFHERLNTEVVDFFDRTLAVGDTGR